MPLFFEFKLGEHGWADAVFGDDTGRANLTASYLSDALGDLVRAVHSALIGTDSECSWDAEPEEYRWCFSRIGDTTTVAVLGFEDASAELPRQYGNVLFKATVPAIEIARVIEQGARSVLDEFGMDGYERRWERHPFPLRDLDQLRAAIQTIDAGGSR